VDEVAKLNVEDERVGLIVADKLLLKPEPNGACRWCRRGGDLDELMGDHSLEP
jgi:hypothetical protein